MLVELLSAGVDEAPEQAARALWSLVDSNPGASSTIARAGEPAVLVQLLLRQGIPEAGKDYALWSLSISINAETQHIVAEAGGVKPLIEQLSQPRAVIQQQAAAALAKLAEGNDETRAAITQGGGVKPLIQLIATGDHEEKKDPYSAFRSSLGSKGGSLGAPRGPAGAGAASANIKPRLIVDPKVTKNAADALANLAIEPTARDEIVQLGGVKYLVALLTASGAADAAEPPTDVAGSRETATATSKQAVVGGSATSEQTPESYSAQRSASTALARLSRDHEATQLHVATEGAIGPLVALLDGSHGAGEQQEAASALYELADHERNRQAITEADGLGRLVSLLAVENPKAREHAEGALVRLSIENANRVLIIQKLVAMVQHADTGQEMAAAAIANLARESDENRSSIVNADGITPLLALLDSNSGTAKENAVSAITELCRGSTANQGAELRVPHSDLARPSDCRSARP